MLEYEPHRSITFSVLPPPCAAAASTAANSLRQVAPAQVYAVTGRCARMDNENSGCGSSLEPNTRTDDGCRV